MSGENNTENKYVLAMHDVRAKQKFIYRSERLKEIIGGSGIIRDVFDDYLYDAAKEVRNKELDNKQIKDSAAIYNYNKEASDEGRFSFEDFKGRMNGDQYIGEVIYDGGGNLFVLYKNADICKKVTAAFTRKILENIGTLKVICTFIENLNPGDYDGDRKRLYEKHHYTESQEDPIAPYGTLPIVQADYLTSMPLTNFYKIAGKNTAVTKEVYAKYCKYSDCEKEKFSKDKNKDKSTRIVYENILDNLVEQKGEESLLAVIYIDGNNMGAKIAEYTNSDNDKSYDSCISKLREFSKEIQADFIDGRLKTIDEKINESFEKRGNGVFRLVVGSGDEITIITNARAAFKVACAYLDGLKGLKKESGESKGWSSCAGISIFHSHTPFADAYRIAEECCETGKQYMKKRAAEAKKKKDEAQSRNDTEQAERAEKEQKKWENVCMLDFHFNQGAIGVSLEDIRDAERTSEFSVPWLICEGDSSEDDSCEEGVISCVVDVQQTQDNSQSVKHDEKPAGGAKDGGQRELAGQGEAATQVSVNESGADAQGKARTNSVELQGDIGQMAELLNIFGRGNTKGLLQAARRGDEALMMEIKRISAHVADKNKKERLESIDTFLYNGDKTKSKLNGKIRGLMIQMIPVYDIWFARKEKEENNTDEKGKN